MHSRRLQQVVINLVVISDRTDDVRRDVTLVVEGLQASEYAQVLAFLGLRLCGRAVRIAVDPLLYFDQAGSVVDFVGCVGGLAGDGVDLAYEGYLRGLLDEWLERGGRIAYLCYF
jgi:hypothetical protein